MIDAPTAAGWRGYELIDRDGDKIGTIGDVYLDRQTEQPEWVTVKTRLFGTRETFVPIRDATSEGEIVRVPFEKGLVKDAPSIDPDQELGQDEERELYDHYGVDYGEERSDTQLPQPGVDAGQESVGETGSPRGDATDREREGDEESDQGAPTPAEGERGVAVPGESDREEDERSAGERRVQEGATTERVTEEPVGKGAETRLRLRRYVVTEEVRVPVQREEVRVERDE